MYANLHCRYTVPTPPGGRVHTGSEDQGPGPLCLCTQICTAGTLYPLPLGPEFIRELRKGPGPLRLCAQICTAGTVDPLPLGSEFIRDLRIKALDLSVFVCKSTLRYCVPTPPGGRVHTGSEDQGPGPLRLCTRICTGGTLYLLSLGSEFIRDLRIKTLDLSVFVRKSAL